MKTNVVVATDGACSGNPGPGGWAAVLQCEDKEKIIKGHKTMTTNNEMELTAVVCALSALKWPCTVKVLTDSAYIANQVNGGYLDGWSKNGWVTKEGKPVQNLALWQEMLKLLEKHSVTFEKVKGHAGHPLNTKADQEACCERDLAKVLSFRIIGGQA